MRVAICNIVIENGDAVTNDMLGMREVLLKQGYEVCLFAQQTSINLPFIQPVDRIPFFIGNRDDLLIYHHATGWEYGISLLERIKCTKIVKYHNITPSDFFIGYDSDYVRVCDEGRRQLLDLAQISECIFMPCSDWSLDELVSAGIRREMCRVVPPFHHVEKIKNTEADLEILERYNDGEAHLLMVGRMAPNKNHLYLIECFLKYLRDYNRRSILFIVGGQDPKLSSYAEQVEALISKLDLSDRVIVTGKVSEAALKSYYLLAHIFLMASLHEGFCVPVVEAMAMKIPIVAYGCAAVPDTVGNCGIVWGERDTALMAASINRVINDRFVMAELGKLGWMRYLEHFTNEKIGEVFMEALNSFLS